MTLRFKAYVIRLYLTAFALFVVNKFVARPLVLGKDFSEVLGIFVLSVPNTCEAIIGMVTVAGLLTLAKQSFHPRFDHVTDQGVNVITLVVAGIYVITQELKIHNLGGNNVYDPYDVAASVVGLTLMFLLFSWFGIFEWESGSER